jgi:phosphatidylserine/phosphatidylglycerophosphate/cardiolipin synthase-like enzyme
MRDQWLQDANPSDLDALARAVREARLAPPYAAPAVHLAGFGEGAAELLAGLGGAPPDAVAWFLERLAAERRAWAERFGRVAHLVWTGGSDSFRDTKVVLDDLFRRAERHVLISSYVLYQGTALLAALVERLRARPNIAVELYLNVESDSERNADTRAAEFAREFARDHWPSDLPLPAMYFDAEARTSGARRTKLHAKCVVVDERWAFVTSANLSEAAQERNIEAGVLLDHSGLAEALSARFRALRSEGRVRRMGDKR